MITTLIKLGGALVSDPAALAALWQGVRVLQAEGPVVVVHGGGPQATALARRLGHEPRMVHGRRVTTDLDLNVLKWTLRGALNADLVASAQAAGLDAVGLCGADGGLVRVTQRPPRTIDGETVDFGHVGDVATVNTRVVTTLLAGSFVPVIASLSADADGQLYNVNADTFSCALAAALGAQRYLLATETGGVRRDAADPASHLAVLDAATYAAGVEEGWISGGMRVKVDTAREALEAGIPEVAIVAPDDVATRTRGTRLA